MSVPALSNNLIHRINVGDSLTRTAARHPDRIAVVDGERRVTYVELNAWINRVANALAARGYTTGDALALASGNSVEFLVTYYACAKLGVVCVPLNLGWRPEEMTYVLGHSEARGLVVESQLVATLERAVAESDAVTDVFVARGVDGRDDLPFRGREPEPFSALDAGPETEPEHLVEDRAPLTYLYTSGTTSFPKGVVGNHAAIYLESMMMALEARFTEHDRFVAMMPMFHTAQLNCHCTPAILVGATLHIRRAFDPTDLLETIEREQITQIFGLPMMYRAMLDHPAIAGTDLSSLRRALYAMAPMPEAQIKRCIDVFGCDFYLLFGQTEMSPTATLFRPEHQLSHNGAVGTPVVTVQVGIMNDGRLEPPGTTGEIVYRGPHTMTEYLKNPEATAEAFAHGWFHSGDIGAFDDDGILWFHDRSKDVIKSGGENVASIEVEKAVYAADPNVSEVVVVGLPHERWSEAITAFVVPASGTTLDPEVLTAALKQRLDGFKVPKAVIVLDSLPKTSTGKIQKNVVRDTHRGHYSS